MHRTLWKTSAASLVILFAGLSATTSSPAEAASETADFYVSANVVNECTNFGGSLAFGEIRPDILQDVDTAGYLTVRCDSGTYAWITLSYGSYASPGTRRMNSGPDYLNYDLYVDPSRSTQWGDGTLGTSVSYWGTGFNESIPVYGRIPAGQSVPKGYYGDVVRASVNF